MVAVRVCERFIAFALQSPPPNTKKQIPVIEEEKVKR